MLFRKKLDKFCACCSHAARLNNGQMLCAKHGFVSPDFRCCRFRYDPLKREPNKPLTKDPDMADKLDFSL